MVFLGLERAAGKKWAQEQQFWVTAQKTGSLWEMIIVCSFEKLGF